MEHCELPRWQSERTALGMTARRRIRAAGRLQGGRGQLVVVGEVVGRLLILVEKMVDRSFQNSSGKDKHQTI